MSERVVLSYGDFEHPRHRADGDAGGLGRHGPAERWPGVLAAELGAGWRVVEEGLPGRTTVYPDPVVGRCTRTGSRCCPAILESHRPLDLVVLMLGTNDLKQRFQVPAVRDRASRSRGSSTTSATAMPGRGRRSRRILLVAPPPVLEAGCLAEIFAGGAAKSQRLAAAYADDGAAPRLRLPRRRAGDRVEPARRGAFRRRRARQARPGGGGGA